MLGALTFVAEKTDNLAVKIVMAFSYLSLFKYFQSYFHLFEFMHVSFLKRRSRMARTASLVISILLGVTVYLLLPYSIPALEGSGPNERLKVDPANPAAQPSDRYSQSRTSRAFSHVALPPKEKYIFIVNGNYLATKARRHKGYNDIEKLSRTSP